MIRILHSVSNMDRAGIETMLMRCLQKGLRLSNAAYDAEVRSGLFNRSK